MLGVLKRRLKPKRQTAHTPIDNNNPHAAAAATAAADEKARLANSSAHHQVHPVCADKTLLVAAYEQRNNEANTKRASLDSNKSSSCGGGNSPTYPLAPNICVEGGRIEFIKLSPLDGDATCPLPPPVGRVTITRGLQTDFDDLAETQLSAVKERLESRIRELEAALAQAAKTERKDKLDIGKLQKQLAKREATQRDAERERRLRADSESKTKQALQEAARCRSRLKLLTSEFSRMEETVRSMLVYKKQADQLRQEKTALTIAFENRCQQYQNTIQHLNQEIFSLRQQMEAAASLSCESAQAALLQQQIDESRKQYERCLDDVANQVVRALVTQKGLKGEVSTLNERIKQLEEQNSTLSVMLMQQLQQDNDHQADSGELKKEEKDDEQEEEDNTSADVSPLLKSSASLKHCNSFSSECDRSFRLQKLERHLSAGSDALDTRLSLEDKKRHQVLTQLWTELKGAEVTPKRLIEALSGVDSALWVPPQRPVSLNLQLPPVLHAAASAAAKYRTSEEDTGNESPESSGNRDEGYSTMSSDVQAEVTRASNADCAIIARAPVPLEELKEATDETDIETRLIDNNNCKLESDVFYIPINLLDLKPRNSFPPGKDYLPFQHIMRSFSDSHLCIKITTAPSPCFTFSSPISSSPSILVVDVSERSNVNPLRRVRATSSLLHHESVGDDGVECSSSWDTEYVQQWLRLDETRSNLQQQHRDLFELEYDKTELEDWSLSLSSEDVHNELQQPTIALAVTPGQYSLTTLPSIQENNALELEEDASECLWNCSSYMVDHDGHEILTLLMDASADCHKWPYAVNYQPSPENSWSSGGSEHCSKRSSAAMSGCSDDTGELPMVGTDFTRDFYRLVKFESTKSLASTSSRAFSENGVGGGERDATALHSVLTFIAEQQKYVVAPQASDATREFNIEAPEQSIIDEPSTATTTASDSDNYDTIRELSVEQTKKIAYAEEVCIVTPLDVGEAENCSNIADLPMDICATTEFINDAVDDDSKSIASKIPLWQKHSKAPSSSAGQSPLKSCGVASRLPKLKKPAASNIIDGPPHRAQSFHERATSKDVIEELNRMIRNGDESGQESQESVDGSRTQLDAGCMSTGWVHVERNVDLSDPSTRASLLDVMMASASSESSPTSSCADSISSESIEERLDYGQLHKIHRYHRQKKAHATRPELAVVRASAPQYRPSIIGRQDFFVRYGEKEKEAVASFDFLDELCAASNNGSPTGSLDGD